MEIEEDRWLSRRLGRPVFGVRSGLDPEGLARHHEDRDGPVMYQAKVAPDGEALRHHLHLGFDLVTIDITLVRGPGEPPVADPPDVRESAPADAEAIRRIAASSFRFDRFHADPRIDDQAANRLKADWAEACAAGERGIGVLVAAEEERPVGFLAVIERESGGRSACAIDLVAVEPAARGRGVGRRLGEAFVARYGERYDELAAGTQLLNTAAIGGYERLGFRIAASFCALHLHVGGAT